MPRRFTITLSLLLLAAIAARPAAAAPKTGLGLRLAGDGVRIDAGPMGHFTLQYPILVGERYDQVRKPIEKTVSGDTARLKFDGGARIDLTLQPGEGTLTLMPENLPGDVKTIRMEMLIGFAFANGGTWKIGGAAAVPFPAEKPAKPFLFQGTADTLTVKDSQGSAITLKVPQYSFQQMQDNREWGWKTFDWYFAAPRSEGAMRVTFASGAIARDAAGKPVLKVTVDKFGQSMKAEFPDKVQSEEDLKQDVAAEAQWLAGLHPPAWDTFGGLPGSKAELGLTATGFFHVEKKNDRWILVDPEGNAFFHLGVCELGPGEDYTYVKGREGIYQWLPPYEGAFKTAYQSWAGRDIVSFYLANTIRKFGRPYDPGQQTARMIGRLRQWGFNSAGAFGAGEATARSRAQLPYPGHLPLGTWEGFPELPGAHGAFDPFDEKLRLRCDKNFAEHVAPHADDPLILGYFLANEPLYEDLPRAVPALDGKHACKRRLAQMLEEKYKTIAAFNRAWETSLGSFAEVADRGLPIKTRAAAADVQDFTALFFDTYFKLIADTFHKYDKHHMLIGNRFQSGTINNEQLCRISGQYMDVISFNYYTYHLDKEFLNRIYKWTGGRPMILSEFYYNSPKDSGLPGGGKDVSTQQQRGLGYRNYVEQAASLGYVVGIEWFTLVDQSVTGRSFEYYNGENGNTGLVAVTDRPWKAMLAEMMKTNYAVYDVWLGRRPPFVFDDPRFTSAGTGRKVAKIPRATGPIVVNGRAANWPGTPAETISSARLVQGADAAGLEASFKLCWDDANLYLLAHVADATPMKNDQIGDAIWNGDALELFLGFEQPDQAGPLLFTDRQILLSGAVTDGRCHAHFVKAASQPECEMVVVPGVDGKGYTLEAALPWKALGFAAKEGQEIVFDLAVDDGDSGRSRVRQIVWNGNARNSGDRSAWGRAVFVK